MKTWLNTLRYYIFEWVEAFLRYRKNDKKYYNVHSLFNTLRIPLLNWKRYYADRTDLLKKAAQARDYHAKSAGPFTGICPKCGSDLYFKRSPHSTVAQCFSCRPSTAGPYEEEFK